MKVFISWSGERSRAVAEALHDWLPKVIQAVRPFVSTNSIDKGTRWRTVLADEMEQSRFSIICLTPENLNAPWILFEAGALSKQQQDNVCVYLFGLEPADVGDPLSQFQATKATKSDTRDLVHTINKIFGDASLGETSFEETFEVWWSKLEQKLGSIPQPQQAKNPKRSDRELLEDILATVRTIQKERDFRDQISDKILLQYLDFLRSAAEHDPKIWDSPEFQRMLKEIEGNIYFGSPGSSSSWGIFRARARPKDTLKELAMIALKEERLREYGQNNKTKEDSTSENSDS